jgi:hypothetical protein
MANDALFKIPTQQPNQQRGLMILTGLGVWLLVIGGCAVLLLLHKLPPSSANAAIVVIVSFLFLPSLMTFWRVQNLRYKMQTPVSECSMLLQPATYKAAPPALAVNYVVGDNGEMIPQVETEALK